MTDKYESLINNAEVSVTAITDAVMTVFQKVFHLSKQADTHEMQLKNTGDVLYDVLSRLAGLEANRAADLRLMNKMATDWTENFEGLRSKMQAINLKFDGAHDPLSTFGDNVLATLGELKDSGAICEMFGADMAEIAREAFDDADFSDPVAYAIGDMDMSDYIKVGDLDEDDLWEIIKGYVEDNAGSIGDKVATITCRLRELGTVLNPDDRKLYGDNRTPEDLFHEGMRPYADFLYAKNRKLLGQYANSLLDEQNKLDAKDL